MTNAFHWREEPAQRRTPSAATHKRVDLKPKPGNNFNTPITTTEQADRTQAIKGRHLHG